WPPGTRWPGSSPCSTPPSRPPCRYRPASSRRCGGWPPRARSSSAPAKRRPPQVFRAVSPPRGTERDPRDGVGHGNPTPAALSQPTAAPADQSAIAAAGLAKSYGPTVALAGLDLHVAAGETVALLGPNGAGKSTTIGLLLGLLHPDRGQVRVYDRP